MWLPFHKVITGLALKVFPDLFITPRVISLIFGLLSLSSLIWLSYEIFRSKQIALVTAFLGALLPQRVVLSVVPLSEIMFIFLIVTGSVFLIRWIYYEKTSSLMLCAFFWAVSCSVRYEGWIFAVSLLFYILFFTFHKKVKLHRQIVLIIFPVLLAFPVFWVGLKAWQTGKLLGFIGEAGSWFKFLHGNSYLSVLKKNIFSQFLKQNLDSFNLLGIVAVFSLITTDARIRRWLSVPATALLILTILGWFSIALPTHNFWRIPSVWSLLLVPFTAYWIIQQGKLFASLKRYWRYALLTIIVVLFMWQFVLQTFLLTLYCRSAFSRDSLNTGKYLNKQLSVSAESEKPKILIETADFPYLNVIIASQYPEVFLYNSGYSPYKIITEFIIDPRKPLDITTLMASKVRYLVFKTQYYKHYFDQYPQVVKVKDIGSWAIYELTGKFP